MRLREKARPPKYARWMFCARGFGLMLAEVSGLGRALAQEPGRAANSQDWYGHCRRARIGLVVGLGLLSVALSPLVADLQRPFAWLQPDWRRPRPTISPASNPHGFPEGPWLRRGARVVAWIFVLAALSMGLAWAAPANSRFESCISSYW